jgi:hypothetical protein
MAADSVESAISRQKDFHRKDAEDGKNNRSQARIIIRKEMPRH